MLDGIHENLTLLLQRLAVGATAPIYSPGEWASRLSDLPFAAEFVDQLRAEWLPIPLMDRFPQEIAEKCRAHMAEWNSGWPNLWAHTLRVTGYALYLAPEVDVPADQAFMLAMLHDVGKFDEMRDSIPHEALAGAYAREWLTGHYPEEVVERIAEAVEKEGRASDPLVRLLYDADKLEKIGASGIVRRVSQVLTFPNAIEAIARVAFDLRRFPIMKLDAAKAIAAKKREFTAGFIEEVHACIEAIST